MNSRALLGLTLGITCLISGCAPRATTPTQDFKYVAKGTLGGADIQTMTDVDKHAGEDVVIIGEFRLHKGGDVIIRTDKGLDILIPHFDVLARGARSTQKVSPTPITPPILSS